ncbi:hypothetical protein EIP86_007008 [Pleurotus ostreatoroseus]|nr:hypothetical protein EIP86_007008 [Pleurotus ostreatoroseus]
MPATTTPSGLSLTAPTAPTTPAAPPTPIAPPTPTAQPGGGTGPVVIPGMVLAAPPPPINYEDGVPSVLLRWKMKAKAGMKLYVISKGWYVGVFDDWNFAGAFVNNYSSALFKGYEQPRDAFEAWARVTLGGMTVGELHPESMIGIVQNRPPPYAA